MFISLVLTSQLIHQNIDYTEGLFIDYRHFDQYNIQPIYEFGFGLSYTTFKITNLSISAHTDTLAAQAAANSTVLYDTLAWVSVDVCNTGSVYGTEVPQLYIGSPADGAPPRVLRGFEAVHLQPGEKQQVTFEVTRRDLR
jgi:beta-glucosidase